MQTRALPLDLKQKINNGVKVVISETRRNYRLALNPEVKSCNFLNNILALREAKIKGAAESLMLNYQGYLTEGAISNLFIAANSRTIYTPPVTDGLLPGVTRGLIFKLAKAKGLLVQEKQLTLADLFQAQEAFLTLTSAGLLPIVKVGNRLLGSGRPGRLTKTLINLYQDYVAKFLASKEA
jgi:branched-chain amino acid aminotransferase